MVMGDGEASGENFWSKVKGRFSPVAARGVEPPVEKVEAVGEADKIRFKEVWEKLELGLELPEKRNYGEQKIGGVLKGQIRLLEKACKFGMVPGELFQKASGSFESLKAVFKEKTMTARETFDKLCGWTRYAHLALRGLGEKNPEKLQAVSFAETNLFSGVIEADTPDSIVEAVKSAMNMGVYMLHGEDAVKFELPFVDAVGKQADEKRELRVVFVDVLGRNSVDVNGNGKNGGADVLVVRKNWNQKVEVAGDQNFPVVVYVGDDKERRRVMISVDCKHVAMDGVQGRLVADRIGKALGLKDVEEISKDELQSCVNAADRQQIRVGNNFGAYVPESKVISRKEILELAEKLNKSILEGMPLTDKVDSEGKAVRRKISETMVLELLAEDVCAAKMGSDHPAGYLRFSADVGERLKHMRGTGVWSLSQVCELFDSGRGKFRAANVVRNYLDNVGGEKAINNGDLLKAGARYPELLQKILQMTSENIFYEALRAIMGRYLVSFLPKNVDLPSGEGTKITKTGLGKGWGQPALTYGIQDMGVTFSVFDEDWIVASWKAKKGR
ncbi:MAG: hypothetical protein G01um101416_1048 [Microgenomates group bacterium Gr01-1014_16]|nr:MAG: hypothetical protein G01um101416_1048 [Microgenomates group bacterium Gr01-1014_16]